MTTELRNGLATAFEADSRFTLTSVNDASVNSLPTVQIICSGRVIAGTTRRLRSLIRVVVIHEYERVAEPWENVHEHLDWALETIHTVPNAFPEVLPITPAVISTIEDTDEQFAASIIQVLSQ